MYDVSFYNNEIFVIETELAVLPQKGDNLIISLDNEEAQFIVEKITRVLEFKNSNKTKEYWKVELK
ncbi:hypothetical protein [Clostridium perfringens]|uniref:hypothetical protein n=1 Tax=Clostridium perfringens TaxID=1502 RepID=UPI0023414E60|nr:hypothetical protein [Clostridium perfringens]MDC4245638.1 hypothetical protein [Clostridium perfringens]